MRADGHAIRIDVADAGRASRARDVGRWLMRVLRSRRGRGAIAITIAADSRVRQLNRQYRGVDRVTDVLSFVYGPARPAGARPSSDEMVLGDVVIARGVATRQARAARHPLESELRVLALHGALHVLGYDHERDDGRMARVERMLRRRGGLGEGLIERGAAPTRTTGRRTGSAKSRVE
jgi:probable rRNA maturation factor